MKFNQVRNHARFLLFCLCLGWSSEQNAAIPFLAGKFEKIVATKATLSIAAKATPQKTSSAIVMTQSGALQVAVAGAPGLALTTSHHAPPEGKAQLAAVLHVAGTAAPTLITTALNAAAPVVVPAVIVGGAGALTYATVKHGPKAVYEAVKTGVGDFFSGPNTHSRNYAAHKADVKQQEEFMRENPDARYYTIVQQWPDGTRTAETYLSRSTDAHDYRIHVQTVDVNVAQHSPGDILAISSDRPLIVGYDTPAAFRAQQAAEQAANVAAFGVKGPCIGNKPVNDKPAGGCGGKPAEDQGTHNPGGGREPKPINTPITLITPIIDPLPTNPGGCGEIPQPVRGEGVIRSEADTATDKPSDNPITPEAETLKPPAIHDNYDSVPEESFQGAVVDQILADAAAIGAQQEKNAVKIAEDNNFSLEKTSERGWNLSETGSIINERYYTGHALERMAPDTLEVRAILEHRASLKHKDNYRKQVDYVQPRDIPPAVVEDTIRSSKPVAGEHPGTWDYIANGIKVVLNEQGDVVTIYRTKG